MKRRVVVTGLGVVTSLSCQLDDLWSRMLAGESGIHLLQAFETSDFKVKIGGDVIDWNPNTHIDPREIKRLSRFSQFAIYAAVDAVKDSGIDFSKECGARCGVILGSGIGGLEVIEEGLAKLISKGPDRVSPFTIPKLMLNAAGGNIAIQYGMQGPNYTVATACASASNAIGDAFLAIRDNNTDVMITGGTEAAMTRMALSAFQNMKALSTRNESPATASRPFDSDRDGFVFSEGAGIAVIEEYEHAKARGAQIYAEILGYGTNCDAGHITQPDATGTGAANAMRKALEDGSVNAESVDYINAHGTSTPLGDKAETKAIKSVFGDHARKISISSTKSQLGHSLGASGGIELVLSANTIRHGVIPPTINLHNPDPDCDLDYTPNEARQRDVRIAMSNSFGFGGHNAALVLGKV
jgi:3-oxoacyl-[acyl-carrier-protein] synthase II